MMGLRNQLLPATCAAIKKAFGLPAEPERDQRTCNQAYTKSDACTVNTVRPTVRQDDEEHGGEIQHQEGTG